MNSEHTVPPAAAASVLHLSIRGRVQGVGFRESLCAIAARLGIDGWVRNRPDGSVEALIGGTPRAARELVEWSRRGPRSARVDGVDVRPASVDEIATISAGFRRLPTG